MNGKITLAVIIIFLIGSVVYGIALRGTVESHEITINEKWIKYNGNDAKYLISDTSGDVYSIEDSIWFLTFDASDRYTQIKIGETYNTRTIGWRIKPLSWYKNIIQIAN